MRIVFSILLPIFGAATLAGATPYDVSSRPSTPPPAAASAQDLTRARRLADQAAKRLVVSPRHGNGWVHGDHYRR